MSVLSKALLTKEDKGWVRQQPDDRLSIEDPTNPGTSLLFLARDSSLSVPLSDNDVGKPTSKIVQVRDAFCDAYNLLREYPVSMTHNNALGTIIGISPEVRVSSPSIDPSDLRHPLFCRRSQNGGLTFANWSILVP